MNSYDHATTGPIDGDPPTPGTETEEDWKARYTITNQNLKQARAHVDALEAKLEKELEERRHFLHVFDYLGWVASGDDADHVVEDMPAKDDDHQSVIARSFENPRRWNQVTFSKSGPVAKAAAMMRLTQAQLAHCQQLGPDVDEVVDAEIQPYTPEWAETVEIVNVALVGAGGTGEITIQQGGPWVPSQAMVVAAWLYSMAEVRLEDGSAGFDHLVERVQNT